MSIIQFGDHVSGDRHLGCFLCLPVTDKVYKINTHGAIWIYALFCDKSF